MVVFEIFFFKRVFLLNVSEIKSVSSSIISDNFNNCVFLNPFKNAPFPVTVRWSKGQDINAGCGQLATNIK